MVATKLSGNRDGRKKGTKEIIVLVYKQVVM